FQVLWRHVDCLLTPTTPTAAPKIGQTTVDTGGGAEDVRIASTRLVRAINVLGLPALSMPCGFNGVGLPLGVQMIGPAFGVSVILKDKSPQIWSVTPAASVYDAIEMMSEKRVGALLVISTDDKLIGVISERDYARKVILRGKSSKETQVQEIMTSPVIFVTP